jgi:nitrite reductase/ring-hydroxylating ferredoxin subunit
MAELPAGADQRLLGFMSNDEWDALLADVNERIAQMEALPDGPTKRKVFELLNGVDALHREGLTRLVRLFKEGVLEQVVTDPAIHTLMELYDMLPASAAAQPAPSLSPTRPAFPAIPIRAVRAAPLPGPLRYPHWVPVLAHGDELPSGGLRDDAVIDGQRLLLARRDDAWYALDAACAVDGASLRGASLSGYTLSCPRHAGCYYDIRNGARVGGGHGLACHPVKLDEQGRVLVGLDMDFTPSMPGF